MPLQHPRARPVRIPDFLAIALIEPFVSGVLVVGRHLPFAPNREAPATGPPAKLPTQRTP